MSRRWRGSHGSRLVFATSDIRQERLMAFARVPDPTPRSSCVFSVSPGLFLSKARTGWLALTTKVFTPLFTSYQAKFSLYSFLAWLL